MLVILLTSISNAFGQNEFKMPSEDWTLEINLDEFKIEKQAYAPDSTMFQLSATNKKANINVSIFIEKMESEGDKKDSRAYYWSKAEKSPLAKENIKTYETDQLAIIEHDTKEYNGQIVNFHSLNAYLAKNGFWMDVHISKVGYSKKDKKIFKKITDSIHIK